MDKLRSSDAPVKPTKIWSGTARAFTADSERSTQHQSPKTHDSDQAASGVHAGLSFTL